MKNLLRFNWGLGPAVLFAIVRSVAVTIGATLLRGGFHWSIFALLGLAVAWLAVMVESDLTERLRNPLRPRQSLVTLLPMWLIVISVVIWFGALASFAVLAPQVGNREKQKAFSDFWSSEVGRNEAWMLRFRTSLNSALDAKRLELEAEQARVAQARRARLAYGTETVSRLRREIAAVRTVADRAAGVAMPNSGSPTVAENAHQELAATHRVLTDLYIASHSVMHTVQEPPSPAHFNPPDVDLATLFVHEIRTGTTVSMIGLGISGVLELLSFFSLYRGGRRTPLAVRITNGWDTVEGIWKALWRRYPGLSIPVVLEPNHVEGCFHLRVPFSATFMECEGKLRALLTEYFAANAPVEWLDVSTAEGRPIDKTAPLLPQLAGRPLVITLAEA